MKRRFDRSVALFESIKIVVEGGVSRSDIRAWRQRTGPGTTHWFWLDQGEWVTQPLRNRPDILEDIPWVHKDLTGEETVAFPQFRRTLIEVSLASIERNETALVMICRHANGRPIMKRLVAEIGAWSARIAPQGSRPSTYRPRHPDWRELADQGLELKRHGFPMNVIKDTMGVDAKTVRKWFALRIAELDAEGF